MKAFPKTNNIHPDINYREEHENGMDLRDFFTAKAMQAILTKTPVFSESGEIGEKMSKKSIKLFHRNVSCAAYNLANAMMEARNA